MSTYFAGLWCRACRWHICRCTQSANVVPPEPSLQPSTQKVRNKRIQSAFQLLTEEFSAEDMTPWLSHD